MLKTNDGEILGNGPPRAERFLRREQVCEVVGLRPSAIYQRIREGTFPRPVSLGKLVVAWRESEIAAWQAERIAERDEAGA